MKSWRADRFGPVAEVLELKTVEPPSPGTGEVVIRVAAAGVALPDSLMLAGKYPLVSKPPVSPGMEVVGEITAVGEGVGFRPGQRVITLARAVRGWGGFAEYCLADARDLLQAPADMTDVEAAGFYIPFKTAHMALAHRAKLKAGEVLLVPGAAGSSGAAAVQLGKALGATVIALASSEEKLTFCRGLGADHCISSRSENLNALLANLTGGLGADVMFDAVGGALATSLCGSLARHGRVAIVGFASGSWITLDPQQLVMRNLSAMGVFAGSLSDKELASTFSDLTALATAGRIRTPIGQVFGFDEVPQAIAAVKDSLLPGKIVVRIT